MVRPIKSHDQTIDPPIAQLSFEIRDLDFLQRCCKRKINDSCWSDKWLKRQLIDRCSTRYEMARRVYMGARVRSNHNLARLSTFNAVAAKLRDLEWRRPMNRIGSHPIVKKKG